MRILLVCKGEYRYSFPAMARALRAKYGCAVSAMTFTTATARMLERTGAFETISNLAAHLKERVPGYRLDECIERLGALEAAGELENGNTMAYADRILKRYPWDRVIKILAGIQEFWERVLREVRPDALLGEIACATEWIGWCLARKARLPYLVPYRTSVENRFFFLGSPTGNWEAMERSYRTAKEAGLSRAQIQLAEGFLRNFRWQRPKPLICWDQRSPLRPNVGPFLRRLARVPFRVQTYLEDGRYEVGSYHGTPPWEPVWKDTRRILRHALSEAGIFETKIPEGPKVYFPLHMQPEFTTDVRAPFCTNQTAIIENISKSVPLGYRVMVKEHPSMKGERPLRYYRELKALYNVRLLSPSVDSHELIQQSNAVLTITGSAAWEAILYEKPVVVFGPLCYGFYDLIYHCANIADLPAILAEATRRFTPDHDLLVKFVWAFLASAYELEWGDSLRSPSVLAPRNLDRIAQAIVLEARSRMPSRSAEAVPI